MSHRYRTWRAAQDLRLGAYLLALDHAGFDPATYQDHKVGLTGDPYVALGALTHTVVTLCPVEDVLAALLAVPDGPRGDLTRRGLRWLLAHLDEDRATITALTPPPGWSPPGPAVADELADAVHLAARDLLDPATVLSLLAALDAEDTVRTTDLRTELLEECALDTDDPWADFMG